VKYADISLNSSYKTILALNEAAKKQNKVHKIIVMIELGELREGVNREDLTTFYEKIFKLSNISVIGLGSNLGCMYGIEPSYDKLLQLSLYKEIIELRFNTKLELLSGGSSITLPMTRDNLVPKEINHFRIGEAAFFGSSPLDNKQFMDLSTNTCNFYPQIIELEEKGIVPDGIIGEASIGHTVSYNKSDINRTTNKAILDFGLLDADKDGLRPLDESVNIIGITSDMTVVDIGENLNDDGTKKYHVGDKICLKPDYMAVARLLNSKFIEKNIISE
jgi:predicted amino acid racemase